MFKTLVMTTSLAAGLLMLDVAQPTLTGSYAQAAPRKVVNRPAPRRVAARPSPRPHVTRAPRVHAAKPQRTPRVTHIKPPRVTHTKPVITRPMKVPNVVHAKPNAIHNQPNAIHANPNLKPNLGPNAGHPNNKPFVFKKGPGQIKKQLAMGPGGGMKPGTFIKLANKPWPIHKGPHKIWWKTGWKTFVPFTAISVVTIGGAYYWPDSYVSVARPYCAGTTPDGCQLNWQEVPFEGGGSDWQCVTYCARPNAPPPPKAVALVAPPPAPAGRCELEIFSDAQFGGANAPSDVDQPRLGDNGWKNEISSIQVKAGTWDVFTDDEFQGETMRLAPGPYPDLGQQWTKRIGSFMCVQGG